MFGYEANRLEKSWNVSQRILLGLPRNSHRFFIEPLSDTQHIMVSLYKRYLKFVESIATSKNVTLRNMLSKIKYDCRSNTGHNLRKLMKIVGKHSIDDLRRKDFDNLRYQPVSKEDEWKLNIAREIIDVKCGNLNINNMTPKEVGEMLYYIVT